MPKFNNNQFKELKINPNKGMEIRDKRNPVIPYVGVSLKLTGTIPKADKIPDKTKNGDTPNV